MRRRRRRRRRTPLPPEDQPPHVLRESKSPKTHGTAPRLPGGPVLMAGALFLWPRIENNKVDQTAGVQRRGRGGS